MQSKKSPFIALLPMLMAALACANPLGEITPANVETVVAGTMAALTAPASDSSATPPASTSSLLPHSMYFLNNDSAGLLQVYRLDKDGVTVTQVTFEPTNVRDYDVSGVDGSVAYVSNNQLLLVNADGSNRRLLLDGGAIDENNPFLTNINSPAFSPNGETIAFGHKGLNFYSVASGVSNLVLQDQIEDSGNGFMFPRELISPEKYSADGSKLIVTLGYYEGASSAIYYPNGGALVRLNGGEAALICCGETEWTPDASAFYAANPSVGMFAPGLWRVDAATGEVTTLLSSEVGSGFFNAADEPFPASDGQLYYFFVNVPATDEFLSRLPLQLVRSAADGVTNRTVVRPESYALMNEALWAADASFVITAMAPIADVYIGGAAQLVYTDGVRNMVPLVPFAIDMKWGP